MLPWWPDVTIVQSDVTIVVPWQLSTGSKHDYLFCYCPLVAILFEVLRIDFMHSNILPKYYEVIWTCDESNMEFYGTEATILTNAMPKSIWWTKIHKTHIARHHKLIFALLYVKYLWFKHIGLWIHILLSNNNTLWCHYSSTMMTGNIGKYWHLNMVFWVSMHHGTRNRLISFEYRISYIINLLLIAKWYKESLIYVFALNFRL